MRKYLTKILQCTAASWYGIHSVWQFLQYSGLCFWVFGAAEHSAADVELESWQLWGHILGNYILYVTNSSICHYHVTKHDLQFDFLSLFWLGKVWEVSLALRKIRHSGGLQQCKSLTFFGNISVLFATKPVVYDFTLVV